jgi:hypothetical protein
MLILAFGVTALVRRYLRTYSPSNAIVARVRREQPTLRIAIGLLAVSAALASGVVVLADWAASGGPGVLNLIVIVAAWDAFKFVSLACLVALGCTRRAARKFSPRLAQGTRGLSSAHHRMPVIWGTAMPTCQQFVSRTLGRRRPVPRGCDGTIGGGPGRGRAGGRCGRAGRPGSG